MIHDTRGIGLFLILILIIVEKYSHLLFIYVMNTICGPGYLCSSTISHFKWYLNTYLTLEMLCFLQFKHSTSPYCNFNYISMNVQPQLLFSYHINMAIVC